MKKVFLLMNLIFLMQFLVGCDSLYILYEQDSREISIIQLISIESEINGDNENEFSAENITLIRELTSTEIESVLEKLENIYDHASGKTKKVTDYPKGNGLLITYVDNKKTIMTLMEYQDNLLVYKAEISSEDEIIESTNFLSSKIVVAFENLLDSLID
jgi:hypothetical protein